MEYIHRARVLCLFFFILRVVHGAAPWDAPFSAEIKQILEASSHIAPADKAEVVIFVEDHRYSVKADGRIATTIRKVYRVEEQDAVDEWSTVERDYRPWYQQVPVVRARVIGKDGSERWLDPKTIADAPAREID